MFHPNLRFRFIKNQVAPRVRLFFGSSRQQRRQQRILGNGWSLYVFHFSQVYEFKIHVATNKIVSNTLSKRIILIFFSNLSTGMKVEPAVMQPHVDRATRQLIMLLKSPSPARTSLQHNACITLSRLAHRNHDQMLTYFPQYAFFYSLTH